ncbi:MAG TPA: biopolymer transporter ExbD [Steroidobacteraceae bacterium]|jgi:biopolymer transport protein ExbD
MYETHARSLRKPAGLLLVPMIDIFTVLVTFLLMTAVFARITILQLDLPSAAAGSPSEPTFRLEVIVRQEGLELTNGSTRIAAIPTVNGEYDLKTLSELALSLKRDHPDVDSASVLLEAEVKYDSLIQVMDAIRSIELPPGDARLAEPGVAPSQTAASDPAAAQPTRVALFTKIAVGDAP